ncbi:MAG: D-alanine--D-alanyl carrier protein ligase [Chroococcopsis gigantea SAG 12.99]|nr:amino acid adenylation domain-containing protein [Chlorogloea purpurea SAG 13.99]MDV2998474.1 D-alanine--D-alanyl carrier protein ligase [Chroococcopsis gigantea SAG 12.99]
MNNQHLLWRRQYVINKNLNTEIYTFEIDRSSLDEIIIPNEGQSNNLLPILLTVMKILLFKDTGMKNIGITVSVDQEVSEKFPKYVNIITDIETELTFDDLLKKVDNALKVIDGEQIITDDPSNIPEIFFKCGEIDSTGEIENYVASSNNANDIFALKVNFFHTAFELSGIFQYDSTVWEISTIERLATQFKALLENISVGRKSSISQLPLITEEERRRVLVEWNDTRGDYPRDKGIHEIFEEMVEQNPEATAIVFEDYHLTYLELDRRANQLARYLRRLGVASESLVGICLERSLDTIMGLLAILKAGGAYVPLDPDYPRERLSEILSDSGAELILTREKWLDTLPESQATIVCWETVAGYSSEESQDKLPDIGNGERLAYVMYTSGSTGKPKGVCVVHRGIARLVKSNNYADFGRDQIFLQLAPLSFDASTFEIWGALLNGGRLVIFPATKPSLKEIGQVVKQYNISTLWLTAGLFHLMVDERLEDLTGLRQLIAGGDTLSVSHVLKCITQLPSCQLINGYGPTENTTFTCCYPLTEANWSGSSVPIGRPIANTKVYVLDRFLEPVPIGVQGELYIGGDGLARGYLNRIELTAERFIPDPFGDEGDRLYKTGDIVRYCPDGNLEFIGRVDDQVKIRGFRIEPGEIEAALKRYPGIRNAVASVREDRPGDKQLIAYCVWEQGQVEDYGNLRSYLRDTLPEYMIPAIFQPLESLPLTPNGKIDRRALPAPDRGKPELDKDYVAPQTRFELILSDLWKDLLQLPEIGIHDNFFDLGGNSLLSVRAINRLEKQFNIAIPIVTFYEYPTIHALAFYLSGKRSLIQERDGTPRPEPEGTTRGDIAIIGMVGRFPGAGDVEELWKNLADGIASITFFTDAQLDPSIDPDLKNNPNYVKARGILDGADCFDAAFFGIGCREAQMMDPQQRIFLEVAHEALENAGYDPDRFQGSIGLYAGSGTNTYLANNLAQHPSAIASFGEFQTMLVNEKDFLTTRVAYKLNLKGPAVSVNTACSTSLVAVIEAVKSLRNRECHIALAGGISIASPINSGYLYQEGGMLSPDGHCRPFDREARGTLFNNGVGIVVLKPLDNALQDGDRIEAVIRGVGINNDGANKVSFTAPSVEGQAAVIGKALIDADVKPETISYVEAHGTATPLGDPIEIAALTKAFRTGTSKKGFCAIGSLKSNVGHLVCAAGVAGLIKTVLALKHKQIPSTLHFQDPNPALDLPNTPFYVNDKSIEWLTDHLPRRAGVSSFGVGGTNAHIIVEEAPPLHLSGPSRPVQLMLLSARSPAALDDATKRLAGHLATNPQISTADVAYTLQVGRRNLPHRRFVVCDDQESARSRLTALPPHHTGTGESGERSREIVFLFPGQASQYSGMGRNLYRHEPVFRETIDLCAEILRPQLDQDLREILYPPEGIDTSDALRQTQITQPAIFAVEYALAQLWNHWGIYPAAALGHSVGEFVAACLAGVFSLEDGLGLVAFRGRLMQELPPGSMLSVRAGAAEIRGRLTAELAIAAINGPSLCVVSGATPAIERLQEELEKEGIACKLLHTSHAFHSPMMEPMMEPFRRYCEKLCLHEPRLPIVSCITGRWLEREQAIDPLYWAGLSRETVRFADSIQTLWQQSDRILLEVGPRSTTTTLAKQQARDLKQQVAISCLSDGEGGEWTGLLRAIGQLWVAGVSIDWKRFYERENRHRLGLPTYPFERQRFWLDPDPTKTLPPPASSEIAEPYANLSPTPEKTMPQLRKLHLITLLEEVLESTAGLEAEGIERTATFLDMGLDSLSLTQVALALTKKFSLKITFRSLMEDYPSLATLADFLEEQLPKDAFLPPVPSVMTPEFLANNIPIPPESTASGTIEALVAQQLQIMARQLELLGGGSSSPPRSPEPAQPEEAVKIGRSMGPGAKIDRSTPTSLTLEQRDFLDRFIDRYARQTAESKRQTGVHRPHLADPRTVSGFTPLLKEIVYPIVTEYSSGSKLRDVDGNEYIDLTNGFGTNFFGWSPPFVIEAVEAQLKKGFEIGPQNPLAGKVARLVSEMTDNERVAFCNTGSEAVTAAIRLARTVTGRGLIAIFAGAYHGIFDEVVVRAGAKLKSLPAAPGILPSMLDNVMVLDYGTPESLEILRSRADDLAAIMVEPVQSRRPELQPVEFLRDIRRLTERSGTAFIFDEVVTGFRVHPGGAQAHFGIKADLATYGKVVGGGMPIGIVAGKKEFMDALDGGFWHYGDASIPEVGVTFFAGTFVRHPLALAAAAAVLDRLKREGIQLQESLNRKVERFVHQLQQHFKKVGAPIDVHHFSSFFYITYPLSAPYGGLLFYLLREKGIHIWEHRPCFFTLAHSEEDINSVMAAFQLSVAELQEAGFLPGISEAKKILSSSRNGNHPSKLDARLGKDPEGNPAWYIRDPERPGKYLQIGDI